MSHAAFMVYKYALIAQATVKSPLGYGYTLSVQSISGEFTNSYAHKLGKSSKECLIFLSADLVTTHFPHLTRSILIQE